MSEVDAGAAQRIYKAMCFVALRPDGVDEDEARALERFAERHGIAPAAAAALREEVAAGGALEPARGEAERAAMIEGLIEVVAADGCLDHAEQERLVGLADGLGLSAEAMRAKLLERLMGG